MVPREATHSGKAMEYEGDSEGVGFEGDVLEPNAERLVKNFVL